MQKENFVAEGQWAKGKSKVFLKTEQNAHLEAQREESFAKVAVTTQRYVRGWLGRKHYALWKTILKDIEVALGSKDIPTLEQAIEEGSSLPHHGLHIPSLKQAKTLTYISACNYLRSIFSLCSHPQR